MRLISYCFATSLFASAGFAGPISGPEAQPVEIAMVQPAGVSVESLPATVAGVTRRGTSIRSSVVALKTRAGDLRADATPAVAVVTGARWSPNDAEREGAGEFEILICAARLLDRCALAGVVGVGNRNGSFLPGAESAFQRIAQMGLPVVRLSRGSALPADADNLFIEGGSITPENAREILALCLLRHGSLPPVANAASPTASEIAAIKSRLVLYQREFDLLSPTRIAMR